MKKRSDKGGREPKVEELRKTNIGRGRKQNPLIDIEAIILNTLTTAPRADRKYFLATKLEVARKGLRKIAEGIHDDGCVMGDRTCNGCSVGKARDTLRDIGDKAYARWTGIIGIILSLSLMGCLSPSGYHQPFPDDKIPVMDDKIFVGDGLVPEGSAVITLACSVPFANDCELFYPYCLFKCAVKDEGSIGLGALAFEIHWDHAEVEVYEYSYLWWRDIPIAAFDENEEGMYLRAGVSSVGADCLPPSPVPLLIIMFHSPYPVPVTISMENVKAYSCEDTPPQLIPHTSNNVTLDWGSLP